MGYSISSTTGFGYSLTEDEVDKVWDLYEKRDDAIDWIVESRDEYEMLEEFFSDTTLGAELISFMDEPLGVLVLAEGTFTNLYGCGVHDNKWSAAEPSTREREELEELAEKLGIEREPGWLNGVSYG